MSSVPALPVRRSHLVVLPLVAIIATALNLRTAVTGFSPLLEIIGDDIGFGPALYGAFGTIVTASFAVFGFVASALARRWGLELTIAAATLVTAIGIVTRALAADPAMLVISTIVAFAGVGTSNVLIVPLVKRYFADRLKTLSSVYLALLQVGQFVAPLIAVPVALAFGWRVAVGAWALLSLIAFIVWVATAVVSRKAMDQDAVPADRGAPVIGAWRTPLLWGLVAMFAMTALNTYVIITWLPTILVDAGLDPALGGSLLALFSIFGLLAAFVVPPLTLRLTNPFPIVVVCASLLAIGYVGLLLAPFGGAVAWVVSLGLGVSTFPMCLTLVNARSRTTAGSSTLSSAMQGIGYGIACLGPLAVGLLYSAADSWVPAYFLLFASLVILLIGGYIACRPASVEEQAEARAATMRAPA